MFAAHQKLGRLVAIVDNNELQIDGCIHDVCDPGIWARSSPPSAGTCSASAATTSPRSSSFFGRIKAEAADTARPVCVIARTVKGKGVSFMETKPAGTARRRSPRNLRRLWRSCPPTRE